MSDTPPFSWRIRKAVWNSISILIFWGKKAKPIPMPPLLPRALWAVPLSTRIPAVQIDNIQMADRIPAGETSKIMRASFELRIWLYKIFPPVTHGLPEISADMQKAMRTAYTRAYQRLYPAPKRPKEFQTAGLPDIGAMATNSPYACFLHKGKDDKLMWDFSDLNDHEIYPGLRPLGSTVTFEIDAPNRALTATEITCCFGTITPDSLHWSEAVRTVMCAASTQMSLVNHFNWVHLACGGPLSIATRNHLFYDHPLGRLMWPHMFGTQNSNYLVTKGQMVRGGDFETIFSFTHKGMSDLFSRSYDGYRASFIVPPQDWEDRGLTKGQFDTPVQDNLEQLYEVMLKHTTRYINTYWSDDESLRWDEAVQAWLRALNATVPNGVEGITGPELTREGLAKLCAGFIYMASVQHEALGSMMWNYQMWVDKNPVRIYTNGRRVPVDIFQRLLNANFNLNVDRAKLMQDFSYFALDKAGAALFTQFFEDLKTLDRELSSEPFECWRVTPEMLDANINA